MDDRNRSVANAATNNALGNAADRVGDDSVSGGRWLRCRRTVHHFEQPIALFNIRYFLYVLLGALLLVLANVVGVPIVFEGSLAYPANYAERNVSRVVKSIAAMTTVDDDAIPSAYRYVLYSDTGTRIGGDITPGMEAGSVEAVKRYFVRYGTDMAHQSVKRSNEKQGNAAGAPADQRIAEAMPMLTSRQENGDTYVVFATAGNQYCVLVYSIMPQWIAKSRRDRLPNPQNLVLLTDVILFVALLVVIGLRSGRVLSRKLQVFSDIANAIGNNDLDFVIPSTNIIEINCTLRAFERMQAALKASLERQWSVEEDQRRQLAVLGHDVKTPITIVRGNVDLLGETDLTDEQRGYLDAVSNAAVQMTDYVDSMARVTSACSDNDVADDAITVPLFLEEIGKQAVGYLRTRGLTLEVDRDDVGAETTGCWQVPQADTLIRAVMNAVSNAADYSPVHASVELRHRIDWVWWRNGGGVADIVDTDEDARAALARRSHADGSHERVPELVVSVCDGGSGFSSKELLHATQWLYRGDESRSVPMDASDAWKHQGIGLAMASDAVKHVGGSLRIENRGDGSGAMVTFSIPLVIGPDGD